LHSTAVIEGYRLLHNSLLRQLREVEATSRTHKGIRCQLRLTLGTKEIKDLATNGTLGGIVGDGRVTNGTQLLPAVGTGTGVRGQVGATGRALIAQVNPTGWTHLGIRRHRRVAAGANQIKGQSTNRALRRIGRQIGAALRADIFLFRVPCVNCLIARPADRPAARTYSHVGAQVLLTGRTGDVPAGGTGATAERELLAAGGAGAQGQSRRAIISADNRGRDWVIARQLPRLLTLRAGGRPVPDARPALGAGLDKESIAIRADSSPGGEFQFTVGAGEDESEPTLRTGLVLVIDGRPATGTYQLATLGAEPVRIVHRAVAGGAATQFRQVGWEIELDGERQVFALSRVIFPCLRGKYGPTVRADLVFGRHHAVAEGTNQIKGHSADGAAIIGLTHSRAAFRA
jgi:hypothetical protein